jgi:large subunit ribosomal protein L31
MKANIHPQWNHQATIKCACGNTFQTGLMADSLTVDICSKCHPFFTGEMKFVDIQGRVDRFKSRQQQAAGNTKNKKKKDADTTPAAPQKSFKELLTEEKHRIKATETTPQPTQAE